MSALLSKISLATLKKISAYCAAIVSFLLALCIIIDESISYYVKDEVYTDSQNIPYRPYALVLGTAKYLSKGNLNRYYINRLNAAKNLFNQNKVSFLLLSGDNRTLQYNEPKMMFQDLRKMGIPEQYLFQDFAGFRTLDSVIRANKIFKADSITIISQKFHCERALFIAKYHHINAICFVAEDPSQSFLTRVRETFARVRAVMDILIGTEPYFLGEPEPLPQA